VLSVGEDLLAAGLTEAQLAKVKVIYLGTHRNGTSDRAAVLIPTLTVFEKNGTFVNQQFRLQKFFAAVPAPAGATDDFRVLGQLLGAVENTAAAPADLHAVWDLLAAAVPSFGVTRLRNVPETGLLLDRSPWAALAFPEGETLHYKPEAAKVS
jgi:NADH-quinone oxidoreductase subunit G